MSTDLFYVRWTHPTTTESPDSLRKYRWFIAYVDQDGHPQDGNVYQVAIHGPAPLVTTNVYLLNLPYTSPERRVAIRSALLANDYPSLDANAIASDIAHYLSQE